MKFRKETEFQKTRIGEIPKEWKLEKLGRLVSYIKGRRPKRLYDEKLSEEFIPYLTAEYMRGLEKPKWCSLKEDPKVIRVQYDDVIMIWDGSYSGHVFTGFEGVLASTMIKIFPSEEIDKRFLYYYLTKNFQKLRGTTVGTGIPHVNKKVFEELLIPLPSLNEQVKIAEILSKVDDAIKNIDNAIEGADKAIVKLERLKRGLMSELLTGRIRVREENDKTVFYRETEFQETEIGKIPKEWKVVRLENVLLLLKNGLNAKQNKDGIGRPITRIETISEEKIDVSKVGYVSGLTGVEVEKYRLIEGDILFSHINSLEHIGKAAIYEGVPELLLHGVNLLLLRPDKKKVHPEFLLYFLRLYRERKVFWAIAKRAVNQASINQTELKNLKIFLPPLNEQARVTEILSTIDRTIELYNREMEKLERLRRGLMDLLLTGKVRVVDGDVGS
jgi:type I restriction enzyme S subunit